MVRFLQEELVVKTTFISIPLRRFGNLDQTSRIRCILESGTAMAHVDFWKPKRPQREMFPIGSQELRCSVLVFAKKAAGKSFTVRLEAEDNHTVISTNSMQVHIGDPHSGASSSESRSIYKYMYWLVHYMATGNRSMQHYQSGVTVVSHPDLFAHRSHLVWEGGVGKMAIAGGWVWV